MESECYAKPVDYSVCSSLSHTHKLARTHRTVPYHFHYLMMHIHRRLRSSCDFCTEAKLKCSQDRPTCRRCLKRGRRDCTYSQVRRPGRPPKLSAITNTTFEDTRIASQSSDRASSKPDMMPTPNMPHASQTATPTHIDTDCSHFPSLEPSGGSPSESNSGGGTVSIITAGDDIEQLLGGPFDSDFFDNIVTQDWTQLCGEGSIQGPEAYAFDNVQGYLPFVESPASYSRISNTTNCPGPNAWLPEISQMQRERLRPSSLGRSPTTRLSQNDIETVVASLLQTPIQDNGQSTGDRPQCKCPRLLGELVKFTNQSDRSSISSRPPDPSLDLLFAIEQFTFSTKGAVSECRDCSLGSPYIAIIICTTMDWVLESLGRHLRHGSFLDDSRPVPSVEAERGGDLGSIHAAWHRTPSTSSTALLSIGELSLADEVSRECIIELLKLRLRRIVRVVKDILVDIRKSKNTLSEVVRCSAKDVSHKAESMFGMIEL
jgi:Fungal Zn(2)-Cys(6) binuclear cluster domain